ncbi:adenosylcobinamide-GDP ribazoletransferase [Natrarchaeobius chitinivorans]|uniref:Adenosylcobinamide-GDP ribazoletransferase n=1 Tax=Natrarchaeobius chitinivorans TaxID=1679083 RepID=A0A3N6M7J7_NATCH|nr:adenosylcobinamide-GDP ribazoletransferase [Natrarchaeobius chitinivorans]RQG96624.1 adenosylcobinamide-GDP ribazoletransferase [Natrarchaeobius chitinivorans]
MIRRWLRATRGAVAFLTRLPVASREDHWEAFRSTPGAFPLVGLLTGATAAVPLLASGELSPATVAFGYLVAVYLVTGINHLDGVADVGDAVVVHGDVERRRAVLTDTTTGVGALLAVTVVIVGVALGGYGLAGTSPVVAVGVAVSVEVGAKLGMAAMACFGSAGYDGMGRQFTASSTPNGFVLPGAIVFAVVAFVWPHPAAIALCAAIGGTGLVWYWANRHLGGVSGDVFGAANEIGRVVGLHAGVIAWTLL